ncbi:MAG TPA: hypothetical protein VD994_01830 [Prosthecobacter sp.]|nr:hypothetical protein [Prosthecobacter sp.]
MKAFLAALFLLGTSAVFGQSGGISRLMPPAERARTGIDKLTPAEQTALQDWIIRAADRFAKQPPPPSKPVATAPVRKKLFIDTTPQPSIRRAGRAWARGAPLPSHGHYIAARYRDQHPKVIQLEDNSAWEVSPSETTGMLLWLPAEEISLLRGDDPDYPILMVNTTQGRSINVRLRNE